MTPFIKQEQFLTFLEEEQEVRGIIFEICSFGTTTFIERMKIIVKLNQNRRVFPRLFLMKYNIFLYLFPSFQGCFIIEKPEVYILILLKKCFINENQKLIY